ncbi:hypothetical protein [Methanomicrobium mobile]|uniref:hypothetical protein n=1 Tax=Methanomicrobium mobile TaxID=2205 RepID=UPI0005B2B92B|nr:hypothetical protein [Methanomicrobium mobile]
MNYHPIKQKATLLFFLFLISIIGILLLFEVDQRINTSETSLIIAICTILTAVGGLSSIYFIYKELKVSADIANADFLFKLNTEFFKNDDIVLIYKKLEDSLSNLNANGSEFHNNFFDESDKIAIAHYLAYFKLIYNLIERDVNIINMSEINDLYAYRFFLAVNDPEIQDIELMPNQLYYNDIFKLYDQWMKYREAHNQPTIGKRPLKRNDCGPVIK